MRLYPMIIFTAFLMLLLSTPNFGQTNEYVGALYPKFTVHRIAKLEVVNTNNSPFEFTNSQDLIQGITKLNFALIRIASNDHWILQANLSYPVRNNSEEALNPYSIKIRADNGTAFLDLSNNPVELKRGGPGNYSAAGNTFNIDMQVTPGYSPLGIYQTTIVYTLSSN